MFIDMFIDGPRSWRIWVGDDLKQSRKVATVEQKRAAAVSFRVAVFGLGGDALHDYVVSAIGFGHPRRYAGALRAPRPLYPRDPPPVEEASSAAADDATGHSLANTGRKSWSAAGATARSTSDEDLARTAAAARGQCGQPVEITRGPNGGVMMYLADSAQLQELQLKGSASGKNYIGPPGDAGGAQDREIVSFDGRAMVLRWMDPEVAGRYGTGVYVRCAAEGMAPRAAGKPAMRPAQ